MRTFMMFLPILALVANTLTLHIRCYQRSKPFKIFLTLLLMVINYFSNMFLIASRIIGLYDDVIVSLTIIFIIFSLGNLIFTALPFLFIIGRVRVFIDDNDDYNLNNDEMTEDAPPYPTTSIITRTDNL